MRPRGEEGKNGENGGRLDIPPIFAPKTRARRRIVRDGVGSGIVELGQGSSVTQLAISWLRTPVGRFCGSRRFKKNYEETALRMSNRSSCGPPSHPNKP